MRVDFSKMGMWTLGALALGGAAYTALALARVRAFGSTGPSTESELPPITVLKPLYGDEPHLQENLRSFCDQDYPEFQVILGAACEDDPALPVARDVARHFPERDIAIVAGNAKPAQNPKIGNLLGLLEQAQHSIIVIADSDIRVGRRYLRAVASAFRDVRTGAATCVYGGIPSDSVISQLGAMQINDQFAPSVMVASALEPLTYCFGATIAVRRDVLQRIGGLEAVADRLADDYLLGKLVADAGYRIALLQYVVQTTVADESLMQLWHHELRWARTIRGQRPAGYAGSVVTYALPIAAGFALAARTPLSLALLAATAALRTRLHYESKAAFAPHARATPWLIPLRDCMGLAVWTASYFGKRVQWKSDEYRLSAGGRMAAGPKEV